MSSMEAIRSIIRDEILQVIATGAVALGLIGIMAVLNSFLVDILLGTGGVAGETTMMGAAQSTLSSLSAETTVILNNMAEVSGALGMEGSKGVFCNLLGVGYTLVNCSQLNAFRGTLTAAAFATTVGLADLNAQKFLLSLFSAYAFTIVIPLGLFLRCFKLSRQAGGALVAIGFGFYAVYPTVAVATNKLLHAGAPDHDPIILPNTCNPLETDSTKSLGAIKDYAMNLTDFNLSFGLTYFVLVRVIFMSILNLIITLGFIRTFAHLIGSDIDVSSLARIS